MNEHETDPAVDAENSEVDDALAGLATLEGLSVDEHVAVYEDIHNALRTSLSRPTGG